MANQILILEKPIKIPFYDLEKNQDIQTNLNIKGGIDQKRNKIPIFFNKVTIGKQPTIPQFDLWIEKIEHYDSILGINKTKYRLQKKMVGGDFNHSNFALNIQDESNKYFLVLTMNFRYEPDPYVIIDDNNEIKIKIEKKLLSKRLMFPHKEGNQIQYIRKTFLPGEIHDPKNQNELSELYNKESHDYPICNIEPIIKMTNSRQAQAFSIKNYERLFS